MATGTEHSVSIMKSTQTHTHTHAIPRKGESNKERNFHWNYARLVEQHVFGFHGLFHLPFFLSWSVTSHTDDRSLSAGKFMYFFTSHMFCGIKVLPSRQTKECFWLEKRKLRDIYAPMTLLRYIYIYIAGSAESICIVVENLKHCPCHQPHVE